MAGMGGSGGANPLRIHDPTDKTKWASFNLSGLTTETERVITLPDKDGTLAMTSDISASSAWPIGSVFISVVSTNPNTLLGFGTWSAIAAGRVLVGLDSGDTDFNVAEETGGAKTVASSGTNAAEASHTHSVTSNVTVGNHATVSPGVAGAAVPSLDAASAAHSVTNNPVTSGVGSSHTHGFTGNSTSVVQPYFVVYMWKRTA